MPLRRQEKHGYCFAYQNFDLQDSSGAQNKNNKIKINKQAKKLPPAPFQSLHLPTTTSTSSSYFPFFFSGSSHPPSPGRWTLVPTSIVCVYWWPGYEQRQHHELRRGSLFAPPQDAEPDGILGNPVRAAAADESWHPPLRRSIRMLLLRLACMLLPKKLPILGPASFFFLVLVVVVVVVTTVSTVPPLLRLPRLFPLFLFLLLFSEKIKEINQKS